MFLILLIVIRITFLQIIDTNKLIKEGNARFLRFKNTQVIRGTINDRNGKPLAISVPVKGIWVDPKNIEQKNIIKKDIRWNALADILSIDINLIIKKIQKNKTKRFIYIARQIPLEITDYIEKLKIPGIHAIEEYRRYYPSGKVAAQLVGFTDIDGKGIEGVEKSFNKLLEGKYGIRKIIKDGRGNIIENILVKSKTKSIDIILSIDKKFQNITYEILNKAIKKNKAKSGTAILIDIKTGEILSIVNSPSFNPNNISNIKNISTIRDTAITDLFEPGSIVKPIVIMKALQIGLIKESSILNTMPFKLQGYKIKDLNTYEQLNAKDIIKKSSNVGVSRISLSMPSTLLKNTYHEFGLGKLTNIGLIGERKGVLYKHVHPSELEKATFSFGYGLMVTPLQIAQLYSTIGSYGIFRPVSILKLKNKKNEKQIFPQEIIKKVIRMMESVTTPGGSGVKAAVKGYHVAVKTGTVKKVGKNKKYINKYIAYTAGIAPSRKPKFALVIMINEPSQGKYYGGLVSAPVFSEIMSNILRLTNTKPDK